MESKTSVDTGNVLPSAEAISHARGKLFSELPEHGLGLDAVTGHLQTDVLPGLNRSSQSPNYYGFVTGGATPAAAIADNLVTETDQNVGVHLPRETIATDVEDCALRLLCELLDFRPNDWPHRTFSTGATASNVLGLACGREYVVQRAAERNGSVACVAEDGVVRAMLKAGLEDVQVLTTVPHSSLLKAASIVGLGRACVRDVSRDDAAHRFSLELLESHLQRERVASIVAVSCAEINTGFFATDADEMQSIRKLCDRYGAWLHVDAAFGLLARALPSSTDFQAIRAGVVGIELADSITGDAHKLLNVPYDCGIFLSRHLRLGIEVFQNPNAAYLNTASSETTASTERIIPSPLSIGIENSRRFRALPVYATLAAYGREGYRDMLERQIRLARGIAEIIKESEAYVLLPQSVTRSPRQMLELVYIIVLFRARDGELNSQLVQRINATRKVYVSGTQWNGKPAARFAVANWQVDVDRDLRLVREVLLGVARAV